MDVRNINKAATLPVIVLPESKSTDVDVLRSQKIGNAQLADLSVLASKLSTEQKAVETSINGQPQVLIKKAIAAPTLQKLELPCTDCAGSNPCTDCSETMPTTPQMKDAYVNINLPNQGDPTAAQKEAAQKSKRKTMVVYGLIALAILIALIFIVKQLKK